MLRIQQAMLAIDVGWKSQRIKLAGQTLGEQDFITLHELLLKYSSIKSLELCVCRAPEKELINLARNLKSYNLVGLQLAHVDLTEEGAAAIATAVQECTLKKLDLTFNRIGEKGGLRLAHALKDSGLECLLVARNELKTSVIKLAEILGTTVTTLKSLDVSKNDIKNEGAIAIAKALPNTKIEVLLMDLNKISEEGVVALCEAAASPKSSVIELSLSGNNIKSEKSLEAIQHLLRNGHIEKMSLNLTDMDGQMLDKIALGVKDSLYIETLELKDNPKLDDEAIERFFRVIGPHRSLKIVNLEDTGVSQTCITDVVCHRLRTLHDSRAKILTTFVAAKVLPRFGCKSSIQKLPLDLVRVLSTML